MRSTIGVRRNDTLSATYYLLLTAHCSLFTLSPPALPPYIFFSPPYIFRIFKSLVRTSSRPKMAARASLTFRLSFSWWRRPTCRL